MSACIAALVSIIVDVLFRPWLEVRKDRILRRDRDGANLIADLFEYSARVEDCATVARTHVLGGREETIKNLYNRTVEIRSKVERNRIAPGLVYELLIAALARAQAKFEASAMALHFAVEQPASTPVPSLSVEQHRTIRDRTLVEVTDSLLSEITTWEYFEVPITYLATPSWRVIERISLRQQARIRLRAMFDLAADQLRPEASRDTSQRPLPGNALHVMWTDGVDSPGDLSLNKDASRPTAED